MAPSRGSETSAGTPTLLTCYGGHFTTGLGCQGLSVFLTTIVRCPSLGQSAFKEAMFTFDSQSSWFQPVVGSDLRSTRWREYVAEEACLLLL